MKTTMRSVAKLILAAAATAGCGWAQDATTEMHVKEIQAAQTPEVLAASLFCQLQSDSYHPYVFKIRPVDQKTLSPNLASLMEQSEEVLLISSPIYGGDVLSPGGDNYFKYFDATVLRVWKGSYKTGDTVTVALPTPWRTVYPAPAPRAGQKAKSIASDTHIYAFDRSGRHCSGQAENEPLYITYQGNRDWKGTGRGPYVAFLRKSHEEDRVQIGPGYRLTGGDGLQGLYALDQPPAEENPQCHELTVTWVKHTASASADNMNKCLAATEASENPISTGYLYDPLLAKYGAMPASEFLKQVQATADSLGYATQAEAAK
ncbi:MAG: hypothetical protein ABSE51_23655 [Terracidiphilus sp.]|jgi:hypothetical protein